MYTAGDAAVLYGMVRTARPARIIEVGSGYSTAVIVAAAEGLPTEVVTIDPDPIRLQQLGLLDEPRLEVVTESVQDVPVERIDWLRAGDVLFLDTSHVAKTGSDVLWDFFEILPRLAPGVLVHVHDAFPGFEYPVEWMMEGRSWIELYLLRAFLAYNARFQIFMWPAHSWRADKVRAERSVPQLAGNPGGQIWLQVQP